MGLIDCWVVIAVGLWLAILWFSWEGSYRGKLFSSEEDFRMCENTASRVGGYHDNTGNPGRALNDKCACAEHRAVCVQTVRAVCAITIRAACAITIRAVCAIPIGAVCAIAMRAVRAMTRYVQFVQWLYVQFVQLLYVDFVQ